MINNPAGKIRLAVYTTVFGALWGLAEMFIGSWLHAVNFPFRGALLAGFGAIILCTERTYTPIRGATFYTGLVAILLKFLSIGSVKIAPAAGIFIETVIAEAILSALGTGKAGVWLTVMAACLEGIPHFFVTNWLMYGTGIFGAYLAVVKGMQAFFGLPGNSWKFIVLLWLAGHAALGTVYSVLAVRTLKYLEHRDHG